MSNNGVEFTNTSKSFCLVCGESFGIGTDVIYCYRNRGTGAHQGGFIHCSCLDKIEIKEKGQIFKVAKREYYTNYQPFVDVKVSGREKCIICKGKQATHMGVAGQVTYKVKVPFHKECISVDKRLTTDEQWDEYYKNKERCKEQRIKAQRRHENIHIEPNLLLETIVRGDGKLVSIFIQNTRTWDKTHIFSHNQWKVPYEGNPLILLMEFNGEVVKKVKEKLDTLQAKYDKKGYLKDKE